MMNPPPRSTMPVAEMMQDAPAHAGGDEADLHSAVGNSPVPLST